MKQELSTNVQVSVLKKYENEWIFYHIMDHFCVSKIKYILFYIFLVYPISPGESWLKKKAYCWADLWSNKDMSKIPSLKNKMLQYFLNNI